jgi:muramoyltetrapeptide carboxypeptidase
MKILSYNRIKTILFLAVFLLLAYSCSSPKTTNASTYIKKDHWVSPPYLKKGDTIMYIAPAGYVDSTAHYMKRADSLLLSWGYIPKYSKDLYRKHFTFAGTDAQRKKELQSAMDDPSIKAIWCARGGYGSVRIIDDLNFDKFKKHPKWIIGFSDITVLHSLLHNKGYQSVHALMPISLEHPNPNRKQALNSLKDFLSGKKLTYEIPSDSMNIKGKGKGVIVGGNLSLLVSLLGSKYQIDPKGKILFLEDVGEYTYSYDRMLYALKNAGYFDHLQGLIIGGMGIKKDDDFIGENIYDLILKHTKEKGYPVIFNFPAGHIVDNRTLLFGKTAKIKVKDGVSIIKYIK